MMIDDDAALAIRIFFVAFGSMVGVEFFARIPLENS